MTKIVILGSCRFAPYEILAVPNPLDGFPITEKGYEMASKIFYPAMDQADEVWVFAPDGIGEHTLRDLAYAIRKKKPIRLLLGKPQRSILSQKERRIVIGDLK